MNSINMPDILVRVASGRAKLLAELVPLNSAVFIAALCLIGIGGAISIEFYTLTLSLHSQYQQLSSGQDLGTGLLPLRFGVAGALIFGHVLMHGNGTGRGSWWGLLRKLHLVPVIIIIAGLAVFMFMTTSQATGDDDGKVNLTGIALGVVCAALFSVSFLACNRMVGIFFPAMQTILLGVAQRLKIAGIDRRLKVIEENQADINSLQREIAARENPDMLRRMAAADAAAAVGRVAAEAHDKHVSAKALAGVELSPDDVVVGTDMPVDALDERQAYLKSLTMSHFLNILNQKEA